MRATSGRNASHPIDIPTTIGIALVVGFLELILHEALGHGTVALFLGAHVTHVTSVDLAFDEKSVSRSAERAIAIAGPGINLLTGLAMLASTEIVRRATPQVRYAWWLGTYANFFLCGGYFLGLSFAPFGDIAGFIGGLPFTTALQFAATAFGIALYCWAVGRAARALVPLVANGRDGLALTLTSYLTIGIASTLAGLLNPDGIVLVAISAAAESFGGHSALIYVSRIAESIRRKRPGSVALEVPAPGLPRSNAWIAAGVVCALLWFAVLAPGLPR